MSTNLILNRLACGNPCFHCQARKVGCHGSCEKYSKFKQEATAEKEELLRKKRAEYTPFWARRDYYIKNQYSYYNC